MLGAESEYGPLDLLGSLVTNAGVTHMACKEGTNLRWGIKIRSKKTGTSEVQPFTDFRFIGGIAAAAVSPFAGPTVRRVGHDAATGLLGSFVATETARAAALTMCPVPGRASAPAIEQSEPVPVEAPAGAPNQGYAW